MRLKNKRVTLIPEAAVIAMMIAKILKRLTQERFSNKG